MNKKQSTTILIILGILILIGVGLMLYLNTPKGFPGGSNVGPIQNSPEGNAGV